MGAGAEVDTLCETCFERGRRRRATVVKPELAMCDDCFRGRPFSFQAGADGHIHVNLPRRDPAYQREYARKYRARHRKRLNTYERERRRLKRLLTIEEAS